MPNPPSAIVEFQEPDRDLEAGANLESETARVLAALDTKESAFVTNLLGGSEADDAAKDAGFAGRAVGAKVLGRPRVRVAITALAPLLPVKVGARLVAPYVMERIVRVALDGSDAQAIHAARDLLNLAGLGPVSRSETIHASLSSVLDALDRRRNESAPVVDASPRNDSKR